MKIASIIAKLNVSWRSSRHEWKTLTNTDICIFNIIITYYAIEDVSNKSLSDREKYIISLTKAKRAKMMRKNILENVGSRILPSNIYIRSDENVTKIQNHSNIHALKSHGTDVYHSHMRASRSDYLSRAASSRKLDLNSRSDAPRSRVSHARDFTHRLISARTSQARISHDYELRSCRRLRV